MSNEYKSSCIVLVTKHGKSAAIAPVFERILSAGVIEFVADTDTLGTFSGEIERKGSALDTVKQKCAWGIKRAKAQYAIASEGSFGQHPFLPMLPSNREILYFIDKPRKFHLCVTDMYVETNYQMSEVSSFEELLVFSKKALFPSHGLILRPCPRDINFPILKDIYTFEELENAFKEALAFSPEKKVWAETDMRAHMNPTRMNMIGTLAEKLAHRLLCLCPQCSTPGWGIVDLEAGLACRLCGSATDEIKAEIYGCTKCSYRETLPSEKSYESGDPSFCAFCNP